MRRYGKQGRNPKHARLKFSVWCAGTSEDGFSGSDRRWIAMVRHFAATNEANRDVSDRTRA